MALRSVLTGLGALAILTALAIPASAQVSEAVKRACAAKANEVRPALRAPEREQYIANCIADATVGKSKKRSY